jgi:RNA-directed DNA polymerase
VTGIVVNKKLSVSRDQRRKFRALLHNLATKPGFVPTWGKNSSGFGILGYANFMKMVDPVKAAGELQKLQALISSGKLQLTAPR